MFFDLIYFSKNGRLHKDVCKLVYHQLFKIILRVWILISALKTVMIKDTKSEVEKDSHVSHKL